MSCYVLSSAHCSAPCKICGQSALHNVGLELFCAAHCPNHGAQPEPEWKEDSPKTVAGEQEKLF